MVVQNFQAQSRGWYGSDLDLQCPICITSPSCLRICGSNYMYDGLEGFLGIVISLLESPICLPSYHVDYRPWLGPAQDIPCLCPYGTIIVSRCHDFLCQFAATVNLAVPSVCFLPLLRWKRYRRLTELELQYFGTSFPHTCMKLHKRAGVRE
jgi:hypothetical protein